MVTSVAARFHFDCEAWPLAKLERYYNRHVTLYHEEQATIERMKKEAGLGRS